MPQTEVKFYKEDDGTAPLRVWLADLKKRQLKAFTKCAALLQQLQQSGHHLQRPTADILRDGIHELRAHDGTVQYRILYFFDKRQRNVAIVVHGFVKENNKQQDKEIDRASRSKIAFDKEPDKHTYSE